MGAEGYPYGFNLTTEDGKPVVSFAYALESLPRLRQRIWSSALLNAISVHPYAKKRQSRSRKQIAPSSFIRLLQPRRSSAPTFRSREPQSAVGVIDEPHRRHHQGEFPAEHPSQVVRIHLPPADDLRQGMNEDKEPEVHGRSPKPA